MLDLVDLDVDAVTVDGRAAKFVRTPETIAIPLPPGRRGTFQVAVRYGGAVKDGLIVRTDSAGRWTGFGDNWPNRARHWIPSVDHPSDKATVTVAPGQSVARSFSFLIKNGAPTGTYLVAATASDDTGSVSQSGTFKKLGPPAPWSSFETKVQRTRANYFKVQALGARGAVLRTSAAVAGP